MTNDDVGGGRGKEHDVSDEKFLSSNYDEDDFTTLLMLGEGDFTYSLDLARYYRSYCCADSYRQSLSKRNRCNIHLIATGIDSYDELVAKYKDTPFVIESSLKSQQRRQQPEKQSTESLSVKKKSSDRSDDGGGDRSSSSVLMLKKVSIYHSVNAIVQWPPSSNSGCIDNGEKTKASSSHLYGLADCVVFNHPHLGTEDAARHGRFLCHLFYSVRRRWLKSSSSSKTSTFQSHLNDRNNNRTSTTTRGIFCLTLVDGQYERWNCHDAAERHGFVLLDRRSFYPPPPPPPPFQNTKKGTVTSAKSYYEFRRHQTGKSFASRRPNCTGSGSITGSETFTFTLLPPKKDEASLSNSNPATKSYSEEAAKDLLFFLFPWQQRQQQQQQEQQGKDGNISCEVSGTSLPTCVTAAPPLFCPHCDRTFKEERSRKSHIRDKHPNGADKKLRHEDEVLMFLCDQCNRSFGSSSALQDHVRSKHSALHTNIPPDWHSKNNKNETQEEESAKTTMSNDRLGRRKCNICDLQYRDKTHEQNHLREFDPTFVCQQQGPSTTAAAIIRCQFCSRIFREQRAKLQHENFCKERTLPT